MKKINFSQDVLPHLIAVVAFVVVTFLFFTPVFTDNKIIQQHDIQEFQGSAQAIIDYRKQTGEEALWTNAMFSGMPAYLISVQWGNLPIGYIKKIMTLSMPNGVANIFAAFISYYIMLLAFRVRPYLAIAGALAFGLSSYMIIGLSAGHNGRIGAIAFTPLIMAGIHLVFTNRRVIGFGTAVLGLALHLRENHLQITYYLMLIVIVYAVIRLIEYFQEKRLIDFGKNVAILAGAGVIAAATFFGQFWAITEYTRYSIRGASELVTPGAKVDKDAEGLSKEYAFQYKYGIWEAMTLLIPQFYGGTSAQYFVQDQTSESYKALSNASDNQMANQLAQYTSAYWGPQGATAGPYYAGAIILFLFVIGIVFAPRDFVWWLLPLSIFSLMLSWGDSFRTFNYFMFDYFPGYNKFRSVSFALYIILFAMPLLGMIGLERALSFNNKKIYDRKLLIAFASTGGLCLILWLFAGMFDFSREIEAQLPAWFTNALEDDRKSLFKEDAFRSFAFILAIALVLYFQVYKKLSPLAFYAFLVVMIALDIAVVDKRYLTKDNYQRKRDNTFLAMTEADEEILKDKSYYRVYNIQSPFTEARTSYYHNSIGGYHGAKLRRYQDFYDSCLSRQTEQFIAEAQQGQLDFKSRNAFNMLNVKYVVYGPGRDNILPNTDANGSVWFVREVVAVNSPMEELQRTCSTDTKTSAVIDVSKFPLTGKSFEANGSITLTGKTPRKLTYESNTTGDALAVFSEIYYPKGWVARIDGKETEILRANYILRALRVPPGKHTIEFEFLPKPFFVGNTITTIASWVVVVVVVCSIGYNLKRND